MGSHSTPTLILLMLFGTAPALGIEPGWHYSPLPGEGDRASMGCARGATIDEHACLVVRCENDFSTGLHVHTSRAGGAAGAWELTLDREARVLQTTEGETPYGARLADPDGWLLDGLRHGTFVYLRHMDDEAGAFDFIDLTGSYHAIAEALYWCAPRVAPDEQSDQPGVMSGIYNGETK